MRGCDKFCTFCIVPFTRGRERSRSVFSIEKEVREAVSSGYKEITLLGQNVNSYKQDEIKFHCLLELIAQIPGVERIRYTSPHPEDITEDLLKIMQKYMIIYAKIFTFHYKQGVIKFLKECIDHIHKRNF